MRITDKTLFTETHASSPMNLNLPIPEVMGWGELQEAAGNGNEER
jgi:hypothetical protein